jgi:hypothetical protein
MCVAIIAGILLATFLTLVITPVMYSIVDDAETFIRKHYMHVEEEPAVGADEPRYEAPTAFPTRAPAPPRGEPVPVGG